MRSYISYLAVLAIIYVFKWMPFKVIYFISDFVKWVLQKIVRYRRNTVENNLKIAFPMLDGNKKKNLISDFYRNLSDILLETIKEFSMSKEDIEKRYIIQNPEVILNHFKNKKSVVLTLAHLSNWEWGGLALGLMAPYQILCVYKPIKNKYINNLVLKARSRFGMVLFPPTDTRKIIKEMVHKPNAMVLVADQSPAAGTTAAWVNFFNKETGFVPGPEQISKRFNFPLVDMDIKRVGRGYYKVNFRELCPNPKATNPLEISQIYASHLEKQIEEKPSDWLWTHKRWKKVKPPNAREWK